MKRTDEFCIEHFGMTAKEKELWDAVKQARGKANRANGKNKRFNKELETLENQLCDYYNSLL